MKISIGTIGLLLILTVSCSKQTDERSGSLILTGITGFKGSDIVCINIDSNSIVNTTPIDCYVLSSTIYDPNSKGYGYVNCDTVFILVNPETSEPIKSFKLPAYLSQVVIDTEDSILIGRYTTIAYDDEPDSVNNKSVNLGPPVYSNYVLRVYLTTGEIASKCKIDIGDGIHASTYYYNQKEKTYVLYRSDDYLITIDPTTGEVTHEEYIGISLINSVFNTADNTLICLSYSPETQSNSVVVIDPETGSLISNQPVKKENGYSSAISGYDPETNSYITLNSDYEVLFYDISTGEIKKIYKLKSPMHDIKFWRR